MSCGVGLDPKLLWCRSSLICSLAWEPPYAVDVALKRQKKKKMEVHLGPVEAAHPSMTR